MRLALVADKAEAYTGFERDRILEEWSVERAATRKVERLDEVGIASLFGEAPVSLIHFDTKEQIKSAVERLKTDTTDLGKRLGNPGLVITTNVDRNSTKSLEKLITDLGGEVRLAKESKSKESPALKLLSTLSLSRETKAFIIDHAGDDYSSIIGLVKSLASLPAAHQKLVSIEDVVLRLPAPPGSIPPWDIEPALFRGDVTKAVELYRRVAKTSSLLVVIVILRKRFDLVFKISCLLEENPRSGLAEIAATLGVKNDYPLKLAHGTAKSIGSQKARSILELLVKTEGQVKGGAAGDPHIRMESMLVRVASMVR